MRGNLVFASFWVIGWAVALSDRPGWHTLLGALFTSIAIIFGLSPRPTGNGGGEG